MGFLGELLGVGIRVVATPLTILKDVADTVDGRVPKATTENVRGAVKGTIKAADELLKGKL